MFKYIFGIKKTLLELLVYFGVGMYFGKTRCFQIGVLHWCSNTGYIWQVYFWHQNDLGYGWDDLDDLITYSMNILCMESAFSSMMNRRWIWTWFWLKGKSFTWCLIRCYNTLYIFGKCGSAWLIRFDLRELELIAWAVIFILWLFYVWYVDSRH